MSERAQRAAARKRKARRDNQFVLILDDDDRFALEEASRIEKLTKADVIRRLIRSYYRKLRSTDQIAS